MKAYLQSELRNKKGKLIKRTRKKLCKSYIRQMTDLLRILATSTDGTLKDTSETNKTLGFENCGTEKQLMKLGSEAENDDFGILVGTGLTDPTVSDSHLETQIVHGDSSEQLNYGSTSVGSVTIVGNTAKFTIARTFTNNSGTDITITEVCLVGEFKDSDNNSFFSMLEHALYELTIANGLSGTLTYTVSVTT